jgi:HD-GYP domain-containing protein (c-di-GMP phosphodiesterase class II)
VLLYFGRTMIDTTVNNLSPSQLRELKKFGGRINKFGFNFAVCDSQGELILLCEGGKFRSAKQHLIEVGRQVLNQNNEMLRPTNDLLTGESGPGNSGVQVCRFDQENQILAAVLRRKSEAVGAVLVDLGDGASHVMDDAQQDITDTIFVGMLELLVENLQTAFKAERQIEQVSTELAQTYEQLVLLHNLSTNMRVTEQDTNFLQMVCDRLTDVVFVEGIAILLEKTVEGDKKLVVAAGSGLIDIDEQMAGILHSRLVDEINEGHEALLDSEVDSPFKYDWPETITNIIAVPLCGKEKGDSHFTPETETGDYIKGLIVAVNRIDKPDFDSTDVKLFNSVAGGCAVFIENGALFMDLKELFIGSLKALTSSIDAKDKYTHGHSERVAFISRWIAERLAEREPLEQEQIHKIYLSGLLHDIGKIGIDESVLRKQGRLTEQEMEHIRRHPSIGAGILGTIKQMRDVVPGVLCHHERVDGKGYPSGLVGEHIPLAGKIVQLADCFDAMTSKRTYRDAMTIKQVLEEIEKELGSQFDEKIGRVFLDSDVYQLWSIIQNGFSEAYGNYDFSEYGTAAVGVLI